MFPFASFCFLLLPFVSFCFLLLPFASFCLLLLPFISFCFLFLPFASFYFLLLPFTSFCLRLLPFACFCLLLLASVCFYLLLLAFASVCFFPNSVSNTEASSGLKGFHTLGWRAFGVRGCAGAESPRRFLAFPDCTARLTVLVRSATRSHP